MLTKNALKMMRDTYPEFAQVGDDLLPESIRNLEYADMAPEAFVASVNSKFPDPMSMQELTNPQHKVDLAPPMPFVINQPKAPSPSLVGGERGIAPAPFAAAEPDVTVPRGDERGLLGTAQDLAGIVGTTAQTIGSEIVKDVTVPASVVARAGGATRLATQGKMDEAGDVLQSTVEDLPRTAAVVGTALLGGPIARAGARVPGVIARAATEGAAFGGAYNMIASTLEGRAPGEIASETAMGVVGGGTVGAGLGKVISKWGRVPATPAASRVTGPGAARLGYEPHPVDLPVQEGLPAIRNADAAAPGPPEPNVVGEAQFAEPNLPPAVAPTAQNAPQQFVGERAVTPEVVRAELEARFPGATPSPVDRPIEPNALPLDASQVPQGNQPIPAAPPASTAGLRTPIEDIMPPGLPKGQRAVPEPGVVELPTKAPKGKAGTGELLEPSVREPVEQILEKPSPGSAFSKAYPKEFAALMNGELAPTEAILKALGPGTIVDDWTLASQGREIEKFVLSKGGKPAADPGMGGIVEATKKFEEGARKRIKGRKGRLGAGQDVVLTAADSAVIVASRLLREGVKRGKTIIELRRELKESGLAPDAVSKAIVAGRQQAAKMLKEVIANEAQYPSLKRLLQLTEKGGGAPEWYAPASAELGRIFGEDAQTMAKFIAATSPRVKVDRNIELALDAYLEWKLGQKFSNPFPAHRLNLERAAKGEDISGPKIGPFAKALMGDPNAIVIDTWMSKLWGFTERPSPAQMRLIQHEIRGIAQKTGLTPAQVQERLWMAYRQEQQGKGADIRNPRELLNPQTQQQELFPKER